MEDIMKNTEVVVMNFSGIYNLESFTENDGVTMLDCRDFQGVDRYCDEASVIRLKELIAPYSYRGIHFIDSGDYHYMSKFWTDKICFPFNLLVFDHHTDMQEPAFGPVLSCGDWVKETLDSNSFLQKVILVGPPEIMRSTLEASCRTRVEFHPESELLHGDGWRKYIGGHKDVPLYISIDKDLLSSKMVPTNWDQGEVPMDKFNDILSAVMTYEHVIGVDVCGECAGSLNFIDQCRACEKDNRANEEILDTVLNNS